MKSSIPSPSNYLGLPDVDDIAVNNQAHDASGIFMQTWSVTMANCVNGVYCKEQMVAEILMATGYWD